MIAKKAHHPLSEYQSEPPDSCPCHSGKKYRHCCGPIHNNHQAAVNPEMLMRARYSAFALYREDFLLVTWARETRPKQIPIDRSVRWVSLIIHEPDSAAIKDDSAIITFTAQFISERNLICLLERSTFLKRSGRWYYLDGAAETTMRKVTSNENCPCDSGKKFKRCCLKPTRG